MCSLQRGAEAQGGKESNLTIFPEAPSEEKCGAKPTEEKQSSGEESDGAAEAQHRGTLGTIARLPALTQYKRSARGRRGAVDAGDLAGAKMIDAVSEFLSAAVVTADERKASSKRRRKSCGQLCSSDR